MIQPFEKAYTGDIVAFGEAMDRIPSTCRCWNSKNPLDKRLLIRFAPDSKRYIYFLPETNEIKVMEHGWHDLRELSKQFGMSLNGVYEIPGNGSAHSRRFTYIEAMGDALVYRCFSLSYFLWRGDNKKLCGRVSDPREVHRYVFRTESIVLEKPDRTIKQIRPEEVETRYMYNMFRDADGAERLALRISIREKVNLPYTDAILRLAPQVSENHSELDLTTFLELYKKATEEPSLDPTVPERIRRELQVRKHKPNTAVRIDRDLAVIVQERNCRHFRCSEQIRIYIDEGKLYFFRKNVITDGWSTDNLCEEILEDYNARKWIVDRDILANTYLERYVSGAVDERFARKLSIKRLLAQAKYLSAEQAAKTNEKLFDILFNRIEEGKLHDKDKNLPELFGISGGQLKYLQDIIIPDNIEVFSLCMKDNGFKTHFPDVKKRIYAVSFYLEKYQENERSVDITKKTVFEARNTLNSLEKTELNKRRRLTVEYRDYINMRKVYLDQWDQMDENNPLRKEVQAFGDMPLNMKPSAIEDYHRKIGKVIDILTCSEKIELYSDAIEQRKIKEAKKWEYSDGTYCIIMPKNALEIICEGRILEHCVGRAGYIEHMANNYCTILFLRDAKNEKKPFFTIEVNYGSIRQCYGFRDSVNKDPEVRAFVQEYASRQGLKITAAI